MPTTHLPIPRLGCCISDAPAVAVGERAHTHTHFLPLPLSPRLPVLLRRRPKTPKRSLTTTTATATATMATTTTSALARSYNFSRTSLVPREKRSFLHSRVGLRCVHTRPLDVPLPAAVTGRVLCPPETPPPAPAPAATCEPHAHLLLPVDVQAAAIALRRQRRRLLSRPIARRPPLPSLYLWLSPLLLLSSHLLPFYLLRRPRRKASSRRPRGPPRPHRTSRGGEVGGAKSPTEPTRINLLKKSIGQSSARVTGEKQE